MVYKLWGDQDVNWKSDYFTMVVVSKDMASLRDKKNLLFSIFMLFSNWKLTCLILFYFWMIFWIIYSLKILEGWFTVNVKPPIGYAKLEMLEGADMKPSDFNGMLLFIFFLRREMSDVIMETKSLIYYQNYVAGLSDPYVKGHLGPYRFQTKIQRKTLFPKWLEEFKIPISSWEGTNVLVLQVRDKDTIFDDILGFVKISNMLFMCKIMKNLAFFNLFESSKVWLISYS